MTYIWVYKILCLVWYGILILLITYLYFKNSKPYKTTFNDKYLSKIPSDLTPAELSVLMYKKVIPQVLTANFLSLLSNKIIEIEKREDDYYIILREYDVRSLPKSQQLMLNFFITNMGDGMEVSLDEVSNYCNSKIGSSEFLLNYQIWLRMVFKESSKKLFFEMKNEYYFVRRMNIIGMALFITNLILGYNLFIGFFIFVPAVFVYIYFAVTYKRTKDGNEEFHKWMGFKRYLEEIENFEYENDKVFNYLIAGVVLNVDNVEEKLMNQKFVHKLNNSIKKCVVKSNLYGIRGIKTDGV